MSQIQVNVILFHCVIVEVTKLNVKNCILWCKGLYIYHGNSLSTYGVNIFDGVLFYIRAGYECN
jgi:hypothetical protein